MDSLNNTDLAVISFLTRNFTELFSMRKIARQLKLSTAGIHKSCKELEKQGIVVSERLGSGLFYRMNFPDRKAHHLAAMALLAGKQLDLGHHDIRAVMADAKRAVVVTFDEAKARQEVKLAGKELDIINPEEFMLLMQKRDSRLVGMLKTADVLFGEDFIVSAIQRGAVRL